MRILKKKHKAILAAIAVAHLLVASSLPAEALFGVKIPSPSKVASDIEQRYHIDLENVQDQGELFNVAANKQPAPEVSLFFSPSDPREGEKITAKAFPTFFSNNEEDLYYTWYLKHAQCGLNNAPSAAVRTACDRDNNSRITVEDWKIEANLILMQNGYDSSVANYSSDSDNDGYNSRFGGDGKVNAPSYCYYHDNASGINYEIANAGNTTFTCPGGKSPVCMTEELSYTDTANPVGTNECIVSGLPYCGSSGRASCNTGTPYCVTQPNSNGSFSCIGGGTSTLQSCRTTTTNGVNPQCRHLFPDASSATTGDGSFGAAEERFWGTDPNDPDTADNGNKDEANAVGLGRSSFTWNYVSDDEVGVAVEGSAMMAVKHDDAGIMVMWAFPKNDCPISVATGTGAYTKRIKNYSVQIETANIDLNDCIPRNLVNPAEGGQATNLEIQVTADPSEAVNDESGDEGGDLVIAQASVTNGKRAIADTEFDWKVDISNNVQFNSAIGPTANITADLQNLQLLGNVKGNALDSLRMRLNILRNQSVGGRPLSSYLTNGIGYLRFTASVTENFDNTSSRKGKSDVIIKFVSTGRKISAYIADPVLVGSKMQVQLPPGGGVICNIDALDRNLCRVIRNEIIGLRVDPTGLSNFHWTINGKDYACSQKDVSPDCIDGEQNEINFFPVSGNVGDTYTVNLTANDVQTGEIVTVSRSFHIIEPEVSIAPTDPNIVWPRFLGQYRDITGQATSCPGGLCDNFSKSVFEALSGSDLSFQGNFLPSFLFASSNREWMVDGQIVNETAVNNIIFNAAKGPSGIYSVQLTASVAQSSNSRRALLDIWNISPLDSGEIIFRSNIEVNLQDPAIAEGNEGKNKRYFATLATYLPASVLFSFRILLSGVLILFAAAFFMSVLPKPQAETAQASQREE